MSQLPLNKIQSLVEDIVLPFYQIKRQAPLRFEPGRWENDAEHSWSLALIACALAPHVDKTLDIGKVAQFATVHDLVEIHAGDTSSFASEDEKASKVERERAALKKLQADLDTFPWIHQTVQEYELQRSQEAKFVKSVDKLIALIFDYMEEGEFYKENKITHELWKAKLQGAREKAGTHAGAYAYYEEVWELLASRPDFFYQGSAQNSN